VIAQERTKKYVELILIVIFVIFIGARVIGNFFVDSNKTEVVKTFPIEKISRVCVKTSDVEECIELDGTMVKVSLVKDNIQNGRPGMALLIETRTK